LDKRQQSFYGRPECQCDQRMDDMNGTVLTDNSMYVSESRVRMSYISELGWVQEPSPVCGWTFSDCAERGTWTVQLVLQL
jgi:hypothetical protein